ncbi:related to Drosophila ANK protein [Cephalotrichum gorgonifer]|uniref:Related to Drosophila ANK protein n=1 Tax=Cephalotrichum gorgonifer TaxID=2041049 RepID=A0AAE8SWG4_9PEZI|nr:related to Drosophila ANK protein [Cephalotrichum gorgonifer]
MAGEELEGASKKERLIEACRRNNTDLLTEIIEDCKSEEEVTALLNDTTTVLGNHLYHEAALAGNYEVIDMLLDQPNFECDPLTRREGDTPLHSAIRWINSEPPAQRPFGNALVEMMLEAGSSPRAKNKGGLTPVQLVDPANQGLRELIQKHEYASLNAGDFINADEAPLRHGAVMGAQQQQQQEDESDEDAEFSGSDEEERAEWERRRKARKG